MKAIHLIAVGSLSLLPGLVAQQAASPEARLSSEISGSWQALQAKVETLSPEERIAAVDQWQKTEQPKLEELKRKKLKAIQAQLAQTAARPSKTPVTELDRVNAAIENEFQPIWDAELTPEERIRQVDAAMKKTEPMQADRARLLREEENAKTASRSTPKSSVLENTTPEARLAEKSRKIFEQTKNIKGVSPCIRAE